MIICGPLQAMYIMAAGTGSPVEGAKMLFFFGLGTLPLMMGFGFLATALSAQVAPRLVRVSGAIVIALGVIMLQRGYLMLSTGADVHAAMGHASPLGTETGRPLMVHTQIDQAGSLQERPVLEVGQEVQWMIMGKALAQCAGGVSLIEQKGSYEFGSEGGQFLLRAEKVGLLHWRCKSGFSEGSFDVRPSEGPSAMTQNVPLAAYLTRLIERSATSLEGLMQQMRP